MNKERILELAEVIERQPDYVWPSQAHGFTMQYYMHDCKTPACIAGWAIHLYGEDIGLARKANALNLLELTVEQAGDLFTMFNTDLSLPSITSAVAAQCLRNFAATGVVDWDMAKQEVDNAITA